MTQKPLQIKNEEITESGGFMRSIVIDSDTNHPRPVWRSDRSNGKHPSAGTYQQAKDGDVVIVVTLDDTMPNKVNLNFNNIVDNCEVPIEPGFNFHPIINSISTLVREWLYDTTSQPYLPKGVGWDGETPEIEKIKLEKAASVLPNNIPIDTLKEIMAAVMFTSISVFNDVVVKTSKADDTVDVPKDCSLVIQADKNNDFICLSQPECNKNIDDSFVLTCDNTQRLYIIWYTKLLNNSSQKMALEILELV